MTTESIGSKPDAGLPRVLRRDSWWLEILPVILLLGAAGIYLTVGAIWSSNYYADPYLSPLYSPCLAVSCEHVTFPIFGVWFFLSPALLILWIPGGFRLTCYYYRKAYYRSFFLSPPACTVPDARKRYKGESRWPFILQNVHRYFFWASIPVLFFLWWDSILAFQFPEGFGVGFGTLFITLNAALLSLYTLSCHACRHLVGGGTNLFARAPVRFRLWKSVTWLNERHMQIAWISLVWVVSTDVYIRLLSTGTIQDPRLIL